MSGLSSQNWLVGQQIPIDSFFYSAAVSSSSSKSFRNVKRRREGKSEEARVAREEAPVKKLKKYNTKERRADKGKDEHISPSKQKAKAKNRSALKDVTALQNSPRRTRIRGASPSKRSPFFASSSKKPEKSTRLLEIEVIPASDSSDESDDAPLRASFGSTPSRPLKPKSGRNKGNLLTPPPSSFPPEKKSIYDLPLESSPVSDPSMKLVFGRNAGKVAQTPFTVASASQKQGYPTPESMAIPRMKFALPESSLRLLPALEASLETPMFSSLFSSPSELKNSDLKNSRASSPLEEIPSSQTQYLHYSPKKKTAPSVVRFKPPSVTEIPSSQSQPVVMSPRKVRKPAPLFINWHAQNGNNATENRSESQLNFVVPTSQEDELEISLLDVTAPHLPQMSRAPLNVDNKENALREEIKGIHPEKPTLGASRTALEDVTTSKNALIKLPQLDTGADIVLMASQSQTHGAGMQTEKSESESSTQVREFHAMLDDLNRLADEANATILKPLSTEVFKPESHMVPLSSARDVEEGICRLDYFRSTGGQSQDSVTQSDNESQARLLFMQSSVTEPDLSDDDPFGPTNPAYMAHLGLRPSGSLPLGLGPCHLQHKASPNTGGDSTSDGMESSRGTSCPLTCTQSSVTQTDSDDEDPFPMLPPASTACSVADRAAVHALLIPSQDLQEALCDDDTPRRRISKCAMIDASPSRSQKRWRGHVSQSQSQPMPDIGSIDDSFDVNAISPRRIAAALGGKFRRRDNSSFVHALGDNPHSYNENESEDDASMPSALRDFLGMFESQTQPEDGAEDSFLF